MKKILVMGLAAVATLGIASCDNQVKPSGEGDKDVLYSGILPAADAQGIIYTLRLEYDADHNYTDGDFAMVENYLQYDSVAASGLKEAVTSYSEGDFKKESKQVDGATVEYIRLIPDAKEGLGAASTTETYFVVNADGSLTMVGPDLQKSEVPGLNYTLTVK